MPVHVQHALDCKPRVDNAKELDILESWSLSKIIKSGESGAGAYGSHGHVIRHGMGYQYGVRDALPNVDMSYCLLTLLFAINSHPLYNGQAIICRVSGDSPSLPR